MSLTTLRANAVGDWEACGDFFYCRELLYDMMWDDVELGHKRLCCAPFGGPIATVRDDSKMVVVHGGSVRPVVRIFNSAGTQLGSVLWEKGPILEWGWSRELQLVVVEEGGMVELYSMHGEKLREFSLGSAVQAEGILACCVYGTGIVVLTRALHVWAVTSLTEPRPTKLADALVSEPEGCSLAVLEPQFTLSGSMEVLLSSGSTVWQLDEQSATDHQLPLRSSSSITHIRVSPDGAFVAVFTADGRLLVMSTDFSKQLSEFETRASSPPESLEWCGTDAVVVQWEELLLVVGPYGDHISWPTTEERVVLAPEVDGIRLLTNSRHELLRKVPPSLVEVFRPGSTSPATQLWDARDLFESHNARSDKVLRTIGEALPAAVNTCIQAAALDLSIPRQKALLRAACYGRAFCPTSVPPNLLHDTCTKLRVVNALREPAVGMPLTMPQLDTLTLPVVVARLVAFRQWMLAYRAAGSLRTSASAHLLAPSASAPGGGIPGLTGLSIAPGGGGQSPGPTVPGAPSSGLSLGTDPTSSSPAAAAQRLQELVLIQWACAKMNAPSSGSLEDSELKEQLVAKLKACPTIRYAPLAAHAQSLGRRKLAMKLLEEESSCALQVPLLLSLATGQGPIRPQGRRGTGDADDGEEEDALSRALRKAIESGDTDLVYLVLFHIYRARPLQEFWSLVTSRTLARNLFIKYCHAKEPELLETLLATNNQLVELADHQVHRALATYAAAHSTHTAGESALAKLQQSLVDASHKYSSGREHAFQSKCSVEMAQLLKEQARLERETGQRMYVGLSLVDTLHVCIRMGHHKAAAALKKTFGVTDRRFYWIKIRTLAEVRDWEGLDSFAAERKSPIGWEPFLEVAKKFGAPRDVQIRLIARMPDSPAKAEELTAIDAPREAAEVAARLRDGALFARIQAAVSTNSPAAIAIAQIKERFQTSFR